MGLNLIQGVAPQSHPEDAAQLLSRLGNSSRSGVTQSVSPVAPLVLRDVLPHVPRQDFVDEGLIPDSASTCFLAELIEHTQIDANRD